VPPLKCYLHIGTEKTATTTIQSFFDANRKKLLENGFIYTKKVGNKNNRKLVVAAYNLDRRDDFTKINGLETDDALSAYQQDTIDQLTQEIKSIRQKHLNPKAIIFSSEHFQSRLWAIEEIERLREILFGLGITEIKIIVYLRRPAEIANSLFTTALKAGGIFTKPAYPDEHLYWSVVCDHKRTVSLFGNVFGERSIIPKIFDTNEFVNGSIIDDIISTIGISGENYDVPINANESLISITGIHLLSRLNKLIPKFIEGKPNNSRRDIVSYIERHFSDQKYIMPKEIYEAYDKRYQEENEWVRNKYFSEKKYLFKTNTFEESTIDVSDIQLDKIAELIADIWVNK